MSEPEYISVREAARITGVGKDTIYKLAKQHGNGFPCVKLGSRCYISRERILEWMKKHEGKEVVL